MARRPKGLWSLNELGLLGYCFTRWNKKKEDTNMMTDTITMSNGGIQYERKAAGKLILKHICMKTVNSYYKKML